MKPWVETAVRLRFRRERPFSVTRGRPYLCARWSVCWSGMGLWVKPVWSSATRQTDIQLNTSPLPSITLQVRHTCLCRFRLCKLWHCFGQLCKMKMFRWNVTYNHYKILYTCLLNKKGIIIIIIYFFKCFNNFKWCRWCERCHAKPA